jgi:hypothetical protein
MIVEPKHSCYNVSDYIYHTGSGTDRRKPKIETCGKLFQTLVYLIQFAIYIWVDKFAAA